MTHSRYGIGTVLIFYDDFNIILKSYILDIFNVYLHRTASILDTRRCAENYMYVIKPDQFHRLPFDFSSISDVEQYWTELQAVCTTTPLNRRSYTSQDTVSDFDYEDTEFDEDGLVTVQPRMDKGDTLALRTPGDRGKNAEYVRKAWFQDHIR